MEHHFSLSKHLRIAGNGNYLYHSLFGNLCKVDEELFRTLSLSSGYQSKSSLAQLFGQGAFEELINNYFLTSSEDEERDLIKAELGKREQQLSSGYYIESLQISTSNLCNFACSYCFADSSDKRSARRDEISKRQPNITFEIAAKGIDQLLKLAEQNGRKNIGVKFLGREPLINWRVIRKLLEFYHGRGVQWSLTTNGSLITRDVAEVLARHDVFIVVSVDGPPETHNALRVLKDNSPTYLLAESGLVALRDAGVKFAISSVITHLTKFEAYEKFIDRMVGLGASEIEITLVMQTQSLKAQGHERGKERLMDFLIEVYRYCRNKGVLVHGDWIDPFYRIIATHKRRCEAQISRPLPESCSATSHQISLESSGDLFPCRAMSIEYGHIDNFEAVLNSDAYKSVGMRTLCNVPYCNGCELEGFCQGTCLGSCEESSGDIYQPQEDYCDFYREMTKKLFTFMIGESGENRIRD